MLVRDVYRMQRPNSRHRGEVARWDGGSLPKARTIHADLLSFAAIRSPPLTLHGQQKTIR
jgi:hypothetical protein